jgi:hypothetical protein
MTFGTTESKLFTIIPDKDETVAWIAGGRAKVTSLNAHGGGGSSGSSSLIKVELMKDKTNCRSQWFAMRRCRVSKERF